MGFIKKNEQKKEEKDSMENKENSLSEDEELKACRYCQTMIPKTAKVCPNCGKRLRKNWLGVFLLLCLLAACAVGGYYYMTVYSATERVPSAEAVAEIGQNAENDETPVDGLTAENTVETVDAETVVTISDAELLTLPAMLESAEISETEPEKGPEAGKEGELEKEPEADKEEELEKEAEADKEDGLEEEAEADKEDGLAEEAEADKEDGLEEEAEADKEEELEEEAEGGKESELAKKDEKDVTGRRETGEDAADEDDHAGMMADEGTDAALKSDADLENAVEMIDISIYTEEEFRDICSRVDYKKLLRSQELYLDAAVTETLTVIEQVDGGLFDENIYYLCKREDEQGLTRYYIIRDDREEDVTPILEGDVLRIYGQLFGSCKLPGYLVKTQPVVPALTMVYFDFLEE